MLYYYYYYHLNVPHHLLLDFSQSSQQRCTAKQWGAKLLMCVIYLHVSAIKDLTMCVGLHWCSLKEAQSYVLAQIFQC